MNFVFDNPVMLTWFGASVLVNAFLLVHLIRRWQFYSQAGRWPRITVKADNVEMMRVVQGSADMMVMGSKEYHEAIVRFRYQVQGRDYSRQSVRQVASAEEAEALKKNATITFLYNPGKPEQTLDEAPGPAPVIATLVGMLIVNGMMLGLAYNLNAFLNGGNE